jgi:glycosyltransferase involved in cell wall biosynthesis
VNHLTGTQPSTGLKFVREYGPTVVRTPIQDETLPVSIILPTYQRRELVTRAVRSVLAQTFEDFELIVVDDGSDDGTEERLAGIGDVRIRYQWQENRGVSAARNAGIRVARGKIVAFLDSDNRWLPHHLEVVTTALRRNPEAVLVTTCPWMQVCGRQRVEAAEVVDALPVMLVRLGVFTHISGVAVRQSALAEAGGFDERLVTGENGELWLRLATVGPFCILRRKTIVHRLTRGSLKDRVAWSGDELLAFDVFAQSAVRVVAGLQRPDRDALVAAAQGTLRYVAALRALRAHDDDAATAAFAEAARLLPALSRHPAPVVRRVMRADNARSERLHHLTVAANGWPDPTSDTALFLRARAIVTALRAGRPWATLRLLRDWPLRSTPSFVVRVLPVIARVSQTRLQEYLHGGRESPDLVAGATARPAA